LKGKWSGENQNTNIQTRQNDIRGGVGKGFCLEKKNLEKKICNQFIVVAEGQCHL